MRLTQICRDYFKKYVEHEIRKATCVDNYRPVQGWKTRIFQKWRHTEHRPWTSAAKNVNMPNRKFPPIFLEPVKEWIVFKGDRVQVLVGKDKGKHGLVDCIVKERNWCFVEGLNCIYDWVNKSYDNPGQMFKKERPLLVTTEICLVDPSDNLPTKVEWRYNDKGERVRVSLRTGRIIPLSRAAEDETDDLVTISKYTEQDKDTKEKELVKITFVPTMSTFEEDIMKTMGILEPRKRVPTFWY